MPIEAMIECADFEPGGCAEAFITVTLRVPKDTRVSPGIYHLEWQRLADPKPQWAIAHDET